MLKYISFIVAVFLFDYSEAQAQALPSDHAAAQVCSSLIYSEDKIKCMELTQNKRFDESAVHICTTLIYAEDKLDCLKTIANKKYTSQAELNMCRTFIYSEDKIRCLSNASFIPLGYGNSLPGDIPLYSFEVLVNEALMAMRNYDYRRAEGILLGLQTQLRAYQSGGRR